MKKWLGILGVMTVLAGCQDSTQDVAVVEHERAVAKPDTIMTKDDVVVEIYKQGNPHTSLREQSLWSHPDAKSEVDGLMRMGYSLDAGGPVHARATAADGRIAEVTWYPTVGAMNEHAVLLHVRTWSGEVIEVLGARSTPDDTHMESLGKGGMEPDRTYGFSGCYGFARGFYQSCVARCLEDGGSGKGCRLSCLYLAIVFFVRCLFMSW